jgi:hypothetical protein
MKGKGMAFPFVLEQLERLRPVARPMFGCHGIYVGDKIVLVTRDKHSGDGDEGVWVATKAEFHESLRAQLPSLRSIALLGKGSTNWQLIPKGSDTFEEEVMTACALVLNHDPRIGTIPKKKKPKKPKTAPTRKR